MLISDMATEDDREGRKLWKAVNTPIREQNWGLIKGH